MTDEIRNIRRLTSKISNYLGLRTLYGIILDEKYQAFDFIFDSKIFPKFENKLDYEVFDLNLQEFVTLDIENISKLLSMTNSRLCQQVRRLEKHIAISKTRSNNFFNYTKISQKEALITHLSETIFHYIDFAI